MNKLVAAVAGTVADTNDRRIEKREKIARQKVKRLPFPFDNL